MKAIKLLAIGSMVMSLTIISCKKEILQEKAPINKEGLVSKVAAQDSLETLYMMQSNLELLLADRIISKPNGYVLDISKQEAFELDIPDELYQKYQSKVNELNKLLLTK
ncbi:hypothetical protein K7A41_14985 [Sphingobacterium sp. InxBP1]|uniref:hypothetical protein n=1 Tax=Sphingobacterium sp. InxBP1 TaxID=2870328 RepID=UPI002244C3A1|nr:hypothetical protein [Sphingobacterium sp. InxBP1]MCW8312536.1 hypothetical protein [Sphingobacterium sp. InxBP1]